MYIDPTLIVVPTIISIPAAVVIVKMWFNHKEKMAGLTAPKESSAALDHLEARLAATEQALEAITMDVERVSEQQRFVTKLLTDRTPPRP